MFEKFQNMNVFRRLPVFVQSVAVFTPVALGGWAYSKYLQHNVELGNESTRLAKFERDRNMIGISKIENAKEGNRMIFFLIFQTQ